MSRGTFKYILSLSTVACGLVLYLFAADEGTEVSNLERGLKLTVTDIANGVDSRVVEQVALTVVEGESPSVFSRVGEFQAEWQGSLSIEKRSRLYFSFEGAGIAELFIDGESVLKEKGALGETESEKLRLKSGEHSLRVVYQSPENGAGQLRLMWRGRDFSKEPVPAHLLAHQSEPSLGASMQLRRGRHLFVELNCAHCHLGDAGLAGDSTMGPSLAGVGGRLEQDWLGEWLRDPQALRAHARMPQVLAGEDEVADVTAYLASMKDGVVSGGGKGDKAAGGQLFHDLGCIACHRSAPDQALEQWQQAPIDLFFVGHKYQAGRLAQFLKNPAQHHAATRMPDFSLTDQESQNLATFIRSLAVELKPVSQKGGDPVKGKELVKQRHCGACHEGLQVAEQSYPALAQLAGAESTIASCYKGEGKGPHYSLTTDQIADIELFLASKRGSESLAFHNKAEYAQHQWDNLNCAACHKSNGAPAGLDKVHSLSMAYATKAAASGGHGTAPPDLTHSGAKLRTDWMQQLFKGELDYKTRPWLKQRMPAFKSRAVALAEGLSAQHGVQPEQEQKAHAEMPGKQLFGSDKGFGCAACHGAAEAQPLAVFEAPGVNLLFAGERLRNDYYHRWMRNPQRIDPQTIMPKYFIEENKTTLPEPLEGDGNKQMEAIWQWMQWLDKKADK